MSRQVGESGQVMQLARRLQNECREVFTLSATGQRMAAAIESQVKYNIYEEIEEIVQEVDKAVRDSLGDCGDVARQLMAYGNYLQGIESHR